VAVGRSRSATYRARPDQAFHAVDAVARGLRMEPVLGNPATGSLEFRTPMSVWSWGERVVALVRPIGSDTVAVEIHSGLKFGLVDWGRNNKNLDKLFAGLETQLGVSTGEPGPAAPVPHAVPPGWHPDPSGRHQLRWWDGGRWADHVSDNGVGGTDPLIPPSIS
jgi:hypothetical protein